MKKILKIFFVVTIILALTSCVPEEYGMDERIQLKDAWEKISTAIATEDKEMLISLFSEEAQRNSGSLEPDAEELFEYLGNDIGEYYNERLLTSESTGHGKVSKEIEADFNIKSADTEYWICMTYTPVDETEPDNTGIRSLTVIKTEDGRYINGHGFWTNPGINVGVKKVSDNANLSVGGRIGYFGDSTVFCTDKALMLSKTDEGKTIVFKIREFKERFPHEITFDGEKIYFKLNANDSEGSQLYTINADNSVKSIVVKENVRFYKIHDGYLYYTLSDKELNKGIYQLDISVVNNNSDNSELMIEGDISEFVFYYGKMFYVENNTIKKYDFGEQTIEQLVQTDSTRIFNLDIADGMLYYCVTSADGSESAINKIDIYTGDTETVYSSEYCEYLHTAGENKLIFKNQDGYQLFDLSDGTLDPILEEYGLIELYVFEDKMFFNMIDGSSETWYSVDLHTLEVTKFA